MKSFKQILSEMRIPPVGRSEGPGPDPNPQRKPPEQQRSREPEDKVELSQMTMGHVADIGTNMEDAHFWITRKGSDKTVGGVSTQFHPEHIGVRIKRTDVLDPNFAKYMMMHMHNTGYFKPLARGSTNLMNITTDHVRSIPVSFM